MKKIWYVLLFVLAFGLVACQQNQTDEPPIVIDPVDEAKVAFENKMKFLNESNNYTMEISIYDYQVLDSTVATMVFDGQKTKYQDGGYVAFYDHSGTRTKVYTQSESGFSVKEVAKKKKDFYYNFNYDMFTFQDNEYLMKYDAYDKLESFSLLAGEDVAFENVSMMLGENSLSTIKFDIKLSNVRYSVTLTFTLVGSSSVVLPEVK